MSPERRLPAMRHQEQPEFLFFHRLASVERIRDDERVRGTSILQRKWNALKLMDWDLPRYFDRLADKDRKAVRLFK